MLIRIATLPLQTLRRDESGATAIEYGLIAALVVIAIIAGLMNMNAMMTAMYTVVETISEYL